MKIHSICVIRVLYCVNFNDSALYLCLLVLLNRIFFMTRIFPVVLLWLSAVLISNCASNPYRSANKAYKNQVKAYAKLLREYPVADSAGLPYASSWVGTTNFTLRRPNFVVIHHTAQNSCEQTLQTFTLKRTEVSAHYVICKDGNVYHMLDDYLRAWHAGNSKWGNLTDVNSSSIGIELDNNGFESFTEPQINSLLLLLKKLKKDNNIPTANFIGHLDIAPKRKVDPNKYFPWQLLAQNGFYRKLVEMQEVR